MAFDLGFNHLNLSKSEIIESFRDQTIFITGVTGTVGKVVLEKLLRVCNVRKIYIIVRTRKQFKPEERLVKLFKLPIFDYVKKHRPNFQKQIHCFNGDITEPNLGLKSEDIEVIKNEVTHIFHIAAIVKFNLTLRQSMDSNIRPTVDLLKIAKDMLNLKSFVYVSTAYSNCVKSFISEHIYKPPISVERLFQLAEELDDITWLKFERAITHNWPNTYTFGKCLAESEIAKNGGGLPIAIVRPSIIISATNEPLEGWNDALIGMTGAAVGIVLGAIRVVPGCAENPGYLVPLDHTLNCILAASWYIQKNPNNSNMPVFNNVSPKTPPKRLTQYEFFSICLRTGAAAHTPANTFRYPYADWEPNWIIFRIKTFFYHSLLAFLADTILLSIGKKSWTVKLMNEVNSAFEATSFFITKKFQFQTENIEKLWNLMNPVDQEVFNFNPINMDWASYGVKAVNGGRIFLIRESPNAKPPPYKYTILKVIHYITTFLFYYIIFRIVLWMIMLFQN